MTGKRIAVLTLWRDSSDCISESLAQFEWMENELIPKGYRFVYSFLENDSKDMTGAMLMRWLDDRKGFLITEKTGSRKWGSVQSTERTKWLARYRNVCLSTLDFWDFDYLLVVDTDVQYRPDLIERMVEEMENEPGMGMITPNTVQDVTDAIENTGLPSYYDSWALIDSDGNQGMTFAANPFVKPKDSRNWVENFPVEVNSAFGSIAMIRGSILEEYEITWDGEKGCEHWGLCQDIRDVGYSIVVDPELHAEIKHKEPVIPNPDVVKFHKERLRQHTENSVYTVLGQKFPQKFTISFGICTGYDNAEHLIKCVNSIRQQAKDLDDYEILVIGPKAPEEIVEDLDGPDIEFIEFNESTRPKWITKKKNLLAQKAKFERLCIMHDYMWLTLGWAELLWAFECSNDWQVLAFPQQRSDGGRFWYDWSGFRGPRELDDRQFYDYKDWNNNNEVYISGNIFCVHKRLLLDYPFDESLAHMQEEDLEWTRRIAPYVHFKCAYNSLVCHQKEHRDQHFFDKLDKTGGIK
jgi:hypothetical protein